MGSRSKSDVRVTNLCGGVFAHEFTDEVYSACATNSRRKPSDCGKEKKESGEEDLPHH